jgi:hypothetical protein
MGDEGRWLRFVKKSCPGEAKNGDSDPPKAVRARIGGFVLFESHGGIEACGQEGREEVLRGWDESRDAGHGTRDLGEREGVEKVMQSVASVASEVEAQGHWGR